MCGHGILRLAFFRKRGYPPPVDSKANGAPVGIYFSCSSFQQCMFHVSQKMSQPTKHFFDQNVNNIPLYSYSKILSENCFGIWDIVLEYGIWFWNMKLQNMILSRIMFSIFQNHVPKLYSIFKNHVPKPYSMFQNHIPKPYFKSMFQKPTNQKISCSIFHGPCSTKKWANQRTTHKFQQGTEHRPLEPKKNTPLPSDVPPPRPGVSQRGTNRSVSPSSITWRDGCPVCKLQYCNIYLASLTMDLGDP